MTCNESLPQILDDDGDVVDVPQGSACNIVATFKNVAGVAIAKASLLSLTVTLYDVETNAAINSRNAQSVLDANDGAVASDGTLTLRLGPLDAVIVSTTLTAGEVELHGVRFQWTWNDGVAVRTGRSTWIVRVEKVATVV